MGRAGRQRLGFRGATNVCLAGQSRPWIFHFCSRSITSHLQRALRRNAAQVAEAVIAKGFCWLNPNRTFAASCVNKRDADRAAFRVLRLSKYIKPLQRQRLMFGSATNFPGPVIRTHNIRRIQTDHLL